MELQTIELKLAAVKVPEPSKGTSTAGNPIFWGARHSFMSKHKQRIRNSPTGSAMLGRKASLVAGQGFRVDEKALPKLARFLKKVASEGQYKTAKKLLKRVAKDYAEFEGVALQVVWAEDRKHIAELYFQRFDTVAPGAMDEEENINEYFLCRDWSNTTKYKVKRMPAFNPDKAASDDAKERAENAVQLAVFFDGDEYFPDISFQAGLNYMEAEGLLGQFHPNNISNKFSLGSVFSVLNGPVDKQSEDGKSIITAAEQQRAFVKKLKDTFTGPEAEQLLVLFGDGTQTKAENLAQLQSYTPGTNETLYESLSKMFQQAILSAGGVTSPEVVGLPSVGGLGGDGGKLVEAYQLYYNTVCRPAQLSLLEFFKELFAFVPDVSFEDEPDGEPWLDITTTLPARVTFTEEGLFQICSDAELREMIELPATPAEPDTKPGAAEVKQLTPEQKALTSSPAGQASIDAMLAALTRGEVSEESCRARLMLFYGLSEADAALIVPVQILAA